VDRTLYELSTLVPQTNRAGTELPTNATRDDALATPLPVVVIEVREDPVSTAGGALDHSHGALGLQVFFHLAAGDVQPTLVGAEQQPLRTLLVFVQVSVGFLEREPAPFPAADNSLWAEQASVLCKRRKLHALFAFVAIDDPLGAAVQ